MSAHLKPIQTRRQLPSTAEVLGDVSDCLSDGMENLARLAAISSRKGEEPDPEVLAMSQTLREMQIRTERMRGAAHAKMHSAPKPSPDSLLYVMNCFAHANASEKLGLAN